MIQNGFSIRVPEAHEESGYAVLEKSGTQYKLALHNYGSQRCDVRIEIDGKHQGTWRLDVHQSAMLERPAHREEKFTFYAASDVENFAKAELDEIDSSVLGLIKATFTPEKVVRPFSSLKVVGMGLPSLDVDEAPIAMGAVAGGYMSTTSPSNQVSYSAGQRGLSAGGTGLSGHSNQHYGIAPEIEYNLAMQTVIHLRLALRTDEPKPLTSYSTPIPPPV